MNTDHKLGRAEAVRDMSRVIYDECIKLTDSITVRARELSIDEAATGYVADDPKLQQLRAMRTALDFIHGKINAL
jgi:hypothetical protein